MQTNRLKALMGVVMFCLVIGMIIYGIILGNNLENNGIRTQGIIIDSYIDYKGSRHYQYEYFVKSSKYLGSSKNDGRLDRKPIIGDKYLVLYLKDSPQKSRMYMWYQGRSTLVE